MISNVQAIEFIEWLDKSGHHRDMNNATVATVTGLDGLSHWSIQRLIVRLKQYENKTRQIKNMA